MKAILNYTTSIPVKKSIMQIKETLQEIGAKRIIEDYNDDEQTESLTFIVEFKGNTIPFTLPIQRDKALEVLRQASSEGYTTRTGRKTKLPRSKVNKDQAAMVAWRILKDWLEAQAAIIRLKQTELAQVFLPYATDITGKTLYQKFIENDFSGYLLEQKRGT